MLKTQFSEKEKELISSIVDKIYDIEYQPDTGVVLITFESLKEFLTPEENQLFNTLSILNPHEYGFTGQSLGSLGIPEDLVPLKSQKYLKNGEITIHPTQFLPLNVYTAYIELNKQIQEDIKKPLLVFMGYRSPAYQMYLVLYILRMYEYDLFKTFKKVAMPEYSGHCYYPRQSIDFLTYEGSPSEEEPLLFVETEEYKWLLDHAHTFGFKLSYPPNNAEGIMFEPWDWHFIGR